ncbi:unnamed protein product [Brachionus calyciflorus]|uniref:MULE transposase domain-containing protein n=1 Tax=Brachionus calyciflorus TaxID=104777 RepID=A0A813RU22_9BILA|nr:unnamed protein product [Brachionus calyciflorus]
MLNMMHTIYVLMDFYLNANELIEIASTEPNLSSGQIFLDEQNKIAQSSGISYEDLASALPSYLAIKATLQKRKKIGCPKLPKSLSALKLIDEYTKTSNGQKFLIFNHKNNKILVFCSTTQLEALSKATHWYADGTFRTAAKHYYQLYIIHVYINNHMVPCCYALMNKRRKKDYNIIFKALKKEAKNMNLSLDPKYIMTDFEVAAINSFKFCFPGIKSLKTEYQKNEELANWFKSICSLAIIPIEYVNEFYFEKLCVNQPNLPKVDDFMTYFVNTYFEKNFDIEIWNHFDTNNTPRTNNNLEGYNLKLNIHLTVAKPDIFKVINKFKVEEVDAGLKYHRALKHEKPPLRNKLYIINDAILLNQKQMLRDKEISIDTYVKYAIQTFDFSKLEKKLKENFIDDDDDDDDESESDRDTDSDEE